MSAKTLFEAKKKKVAGSAQYKQGKTVGNCVVPLRSVCFFPKTQCTFNGQVVTECGHGG